jgi:hypothetical protein
VLIQVSVDGSLKVDDGPEDAAPEASSGQDGAAIIGDRSLPLKHVQRARIVLYELIAKREIASVRVGTRRLINFASLKARLGGDLQAREEGRANV